jgi:hypothetical protein
MRIPTTALLAALALTATACSDDTPTGVSGDEAAVQQAYLDVDAGYFDENPGGDEILGDAALTASSTLFSAPGDPYVAPEHWGRRRAQTRPSRNRVVVIEGDTAKVAVAVRFNGRFMVDTTFDGVPNPGAKPMHELARHRAVFVKDSTAPHGWRLVGMSIGNVVDTDPARRTVAITSMSVQVNGAPVGTVTDPDHIYLVDGGVPQLHVGDSVLVTVAVTNTTGTDLAPPTQLFLHVRHCRADRDAWFRIPMQNNGDGTWTVGWTVRRPGIARMAVDAIDSEALQTQTGDNYRANIWAFPYRALP